MTTSVESSSDRDSRHGWRPNCRPGLFDDLRCKAEGRRERAAYDAEHADDLDAAGASFEAARAAYTRVRTTAEPLVAQAWKDYRVLEEKVGCALPEEDAGRVRVAYERVTRRLSECGDPTGCCADDLDCDYEGLETCAPGDVPGRMADIVRRTEEATACLSGLIAETDDPAPPTPDAPATRAAAPLAPVVAGAARPAPVVAGAARPVPVVAGAARPAPATAQDAAGAGSSGSAPPPATKGLLGRVADVRTELDRIAKRLKEEEWDASRTYAELLVARGHLRGVWRGFSNVNEYVDCVCRALTCMVKGHAAIGLLKGRIAVDACYRRSWEEDCRRLQEQTVEEVMAEFIRVCEGDDDSDEAGRSGQDVPDRHDEEGDPGRSRFEGGPDELTVSSEDPPAGSAKEQKGGRGGKRARFRDEHGEFRAP